MTTPYAGIDTFPATIPLPQDMIDKRSAAVFNAAYQPLMDGIRWLKNRLPLFLVERFPAHDVQAIGTDLDSSNSNTLSSGVMIAQSSVPLAVGDVVDVSVTFQANASGGCQARYALYAQDFGGAKTAMLGADQYIFIASTEIHSVTLHGSWIVIAPGLWTCYLRCANPDSVPSETVHVRSQWASHAVAHRAP